jgi:prepilin-type N-terminal cleavage/methylation domain-containing protein
MKLRSTTTARRRRGMTLIELTVVIVVLLSLVTLLFVSARAWKRGSDRAACILNIRNVQVAVRSYQNLNGLTPKAPRQFELVTLEEVPLSLAEAIFGRSGYIDKEPVCPAGGEYSFGSFGVPKIGELALSCDLADKEKHIPENHDSW